MKLLSDMIRAVFTVQKTVLAISLAMLVIAFTVLSNEIAFGHDSCRVYSAEDSVGNFFGNVSDSVHSVIK